MGVHYYMEEVPKDVLDFLVADTDDPIINPQEQIPEDKELQKELLNLACKRGQVVIFKASKDVAMTIMRKTAWVGNFDTKVGDKANARDVVKAYKEFIAWAKENTFYNKLETRTPLEKFAKTMAKASDSILEGVRKKSYMTKEGNMIDEYLVGILLREEEKCL